MYLIVGLGNPGDDYVDTRHNVGFRAVYSLAEAYNIKNTSYKFRSLTARGLIKNRPVLLAQPLTYMNKSGEAVALLVKYYNIPLEKIIIMYDDLDLPTGKIRIKTKGSAGGHKGLRSIINMLGTEEIPRIRIGIDRPPDGIPVIDYVLGYFDKGEEELLKDTMKEVVGAVETILVDSLEEAMNKFN